MTSSEELLSGDKVYKVRMNLNRKHQVNVTVNTVSPFVQVFQKCGHYYDSDLTRLMLSELGWPMTLRDVIRAGHEQS